MSEQPFENSRLPAPLAAVKGATLGPPAPAQTTAPIDTDEVVSIREFIATLRRRVGVVLGIAAAVTLLTALYAYTRPPLYQATATIQLSNNRDALTGGITGPTGDGMVIGSKVDAIRSQLEILTSRSVLGAVVEQEGLRLRVLEGELPVGLLQDVEIAPDVERDSVRMVFTDRGVSASRGREQSSAAYGQPLFLAGIRFSVVEQPPASDALIAIIPARTAVEALRASLTADPRPQTNVVDVKYTSTDPELARRVTDAVVGVFQEANARFAQQQSRRRRVFLEEQLAQTDAVLADAQQALSDFRSREEVYSSGEKLAAQQTGLMGLEVRREEMRADRDMYQLLLQRLAEADPASRTTSLRTLISSPGIASNSIISQTYAQLVEFEIQRDTLTAGTWGSAASSPDVRRLDALIESTETKLVNAARSHIASLDARIAALDELEARSAASLRALPDTEAEEQRLTQQVQTVQSMADNLRGEYQKARIAEAVEAGQVEVVDLALRPNAPIGSGPLSKVVIGLVLGLMLGSGGALVLEHFNTSIRGKEEMENFLRVPGLAIIPQIAPATEGAARRLRLPFPARPGNGNGSREERPTARKNELVTMSDLHSSGSEAYRTLRTNLIFSQAVQSLKTLVVTSSSPAEGKTTTVANLAVTFAQQGMRVLLIDCDLRKARLHKVFNLDREPGLTQVMLGYAPAVEAIRPTPVDGLFFLPAGTLPPNPSELLGGERMREVLDELGQGFDLLLLDTPPLLAAADAAVLGRFSDGVLLVVRAGHTDRGAAQQAMQQLRTVGARVIGAVLNDPDAKAAAYGGYYYYSYYGADHRQQD